MKDDLLKLGATEIVTDKILSRDLYLFLPKNNRMIRIRQKGQFLEKHILQNYQNKGLVEFYYGKEDPENSSAETTASVLATSIVEDNSSVTIAASPAGEEETILVAKT